MSCATAHRVVYAVSGLLLASALVVPVHAGGPPKQLTPEQIKAGYYVRVGSVVVPNGGSAAVAGFGTVMDGRNQGGVPGLAKVPYFGKGFGNRGYGYSASKYGVSIHVRVIDLKALDAQLLGTRP